MYVLCLVRDSKDGYALATNEEMTATVDSALKLPHIADTIRKSIQCKVDGQTVGYFMSFKGSNEAYVGNQINFKLKGFGGWDPIMATSGTVSNSAGPRGHNFIIPNPADTDHLVAMLQMEKDIDVSSDSSLGQRLQTLVQEEFIRPDRIAGMYHGAPKVA